MISSVHLTSAAHRKEQESAGPSRSSTIRSVLLIFHQKKIVYTAVFLYLSRCLQFVRERETKLLFHTRISFKIMALMWTSTLHTADTEAPEFGEGKSAKKFSAFGRSVVRSFGRSAVFLRADRFAAVFRRRALTSKLQQGTEKARVFLSSGQYANEYYIVHGVPAACGSLIFASVGQPPYVQTPNHY